MGTPIQALDSKGEVVWDCILDIYGEVFRLRGKRDFIPFRFQGQYEDQETGLYYNRFRYYSPHAGNYISQDPIGLTGGNPTLYGYVRDSNIQIDSFGLDAIPNKVAGNAREAIALEHLKKQHPNATILRERYIRDASGKSVRDAFESRRRLDFVVIEDGKVKGVYEVTSPTADKTAQMLKETDIRGNGGTHVKAPGRKGALYDISDIETQRLDVDLETKKVKCH
ncbi:MAG: RHS repeat-associated core domain-containing protein [Prevotella sp.]|nr:RHS repeat-associated core domain-containing protein [Prevotella sp.]